MRFILSEADAVRQEPVSVLESKQDFPSEISIAAQCEACLRAVKML